MTPMEHATPGTSGKRTTGTEAPFFDGSQPCAKVDPELFFPETRVEARRNKAITDLICKSCEFQNECLEYAVVHPEILGVWAGTTERQRRALRRLKHRKSVA